nr:thioredoxin-like isoform X3 [Pogona vitticeps]
MEAPIMPQNIHNKKEFEEFLKRAGPRLVVVNFSAKWCGPGKVIRPFVYDVADLCNIVTMPTFQFFMTGEKIFEIIGANAKKLEEKIKELM